MKPTEPYVEPAQTSPDTVTPCDIGNYYYNAQIRRYITQFMAIFSELQVKVGVSATQDSRLIKVPVIYGSRDRVVAWIKSEQTQNKPLRLPAMSAYLRNVALAPDKRKGLGAVRRNTVARLGRPFPENVEVVYQQQPIPYRATFELSTFASNDNQHFQIMEQIFMLFDPILQIQTSDDPIDWTQITTVEMTNINWEENFPAGADRRYTQSVINFEVIFYICGPAEFKKNYIETIKLRLAVVPTTVNISNEWEVLNYLDTEGVGYKDIIDISNINIEKP